MKKSLFPLVSVAFCISLGLMQPVTALAVFTPKNQPEHCPKFEDFKTHAVISETDKAWVSTNIYHTIRTYFAHFPSLPDTYNFDDEFQNFLKNTANIHSRWAYDLEAFKLFASLKNGHTQFFDGNLTCQTDHLPFRATYFPGTGWIVTRSFLPELPQGALIKKIDGKDFNQWASKQKEYISASSDRAGNSMLFYRNELWPENFTLDLDNGQKIQIDREKPTKQSKTPPAKFTAKKIQKNVYLLNLPNFDDPSIEKGARNFIETHKNAKAMLFNVIGNGGGASPETLTDAILTHPYQKLIEETPQIQAVNEGNLSVGAPWALTNTVLRAGGDITKPQHPIYFGKIYVVADRNCASACEDFLASIKLGKRGPILGEKSFGIFGEIYFKSMPQQHYDIQIETERYFLPDGTPLEGVGITPDVAFTPNPRDANSFLNQAIAYVKNDLAKKDTKKPIEP